MSAKTEIKDHVPFGTVDGEDGKVWLYDFCPDPDGSGLRWFKLTGKETTIDGLKILDTKEKEYHGKCYDTGEFFSHAGELLYELLEEAPKDVTLATFHRGWSAGTKTFTDILTVKFYGKKEQ